MIRPPCHNRHPYAPGRWHATGRTVRRGTREVPGGVVQWGPVKPVLRWHPRWFEDRCAVWDGRGIGPNGEPYPIAHGFANACLTCRWRPFDVLEWAMEVSFAKVVAKGAP